MTTCHDIVVGCEEFLDNSLLPLRCRLKTATVELFVEQVNNFLACSLVRVELHVQEERFPDLIDVTNGHRGKVNL